MDPKENRPSFSYGGNDLSQRVTVIETKFEHHVNDYSRWIGSISSDVKDLAKKFEVLNLNMAIVIEQRDKADKSLSRFKSAGLSFATALAVALIGVLVKFAFIVQNARLPST